ncbi:hypothetical protein Fmac_011992 [Flemingia macrophylla]|uniref:Uncharacterized protein n=1 Tax=Flemingia macrophylla TaxID=520843 RepID=A0ABD1MPF4_9FABA
MILTFFKGVEIKIWTFHINLLYKSQNGHIGILYADSGRKWLGVLCGIGWYWKWLQCMACTWLQCLVHRAARKIPPPRAARKCPPPPRNVQSDGPPRDMRREDALHPRDKQRPPPGPAACSRRIPRAHAARDNPLPGLRATKKNHPGDAAKS